MHLSIDVEIPDRTIVSRTPATDGWTELKLSCGHTILIITAVGEGLPAPCPQCINDLIKKHRGGQ